MVGMLALSELIIMALAAVSPPHAAGVSGTYVGAGTDSAFLIQIVQTSGNQVTGRYEQTVMNNGGKLDVWNAAITGASDGQTIVVTIKPPDVLASSITASGTFQGTFLHLSGSGGGRSIDLNLTKSDEAAYRTEIANLFNQGQRINEAKAKVDELTRLGQLTKSMLLYSAAATEQLKKFPPVVQRFKAITGAMSGALAREEAIFGNDQAAVTRSQISVAINQAGIEAQQLHNSLQNSDKDISIKIQPLIKGAVEFNQRCQPGAANRSRELDDTCLQFFDAEKNFKQSMEKLGQAFAQTEKVWLEEHQKQDSIIQASNVASR
jgi:hypothetical protein